MQINLKWAFIVIAIILAAHELDANPTFQLMCNGTDIPVFEQNDVPLTYNLNTYKYSRVSYTGQVLKLELFVQGFQFSDLDWDISPHSYKIKGVRNGNVLSFEIDRTGYVVIRLSKDQDFSKRIVLFIEEAEELPDGEFVNIVDVYGIDKTGAKNETIKLQEALDNTSGSGKTPLLSCGLVQVIYVEY